MRIEHQKAIELERIVRRVYNCDRAGMGGYIDADHFESSPFDKKRYQYMRQQELQELSFWIEMFTVLYYNG